MPLRLRSTVRPSIFAFPTTVSFITTTGFNPYQCLSCRGTQSGTGAPAWVSIAATKVSDVENGCDRLASTLRRIFFLWSSGNALRNSQSSEDKPPRWCSLWMAPVFSCATASRSPTSMEALLCAIVSVRSRVCGIQSTGVRRPGYLYTQLRLPLHPNARLQGIMKPLQSQLANFPQVSGEMRRRPGDAGCVTRKSCLRTGNFSTSPELLPG